jgi:hypothetical protein
MRNKVSEKCVLFIDISTDLRYLLRKEVCKTPAKKCDEVKYAYKRAKICKFFGREEMYHRGMIKISYHSSYKYRDSYQESGEYLFFHNLLEGIDSYIGIFVDTWGQLGTQVSVCLRISTSLEENNLLYPLILEFRCHIFQFFSCFPVW